MHELEITKGLVEEILRQIKDREDISRVKKIYISLGECMGITEDSLNFYFSNFSKASKLENAELCICFKQGKEICVDSLEVE